MSYSNVRHDRRTSSTATCLNSNVHEPWISWSSKCETWLLRFDVTTWLIQIWDMTEGLIQMWDMIEGLLAPWLASIQMCMGLELLGHPNVRHDSMDMILQHDSSRCDTWQKDFWRRDVWHYAIIENNLRHDSSGFETWLCTCSFGDCLVRSVLQCVAVCCSVLQCVAVCCRLLQCVADCLVRSARKMKNDPDVSETQIFRHFCGDVTSSDSTRICDVTSYHSNITHDSLKK